MTQGWDFVDCYVRHYPRLVRSLRLTGLPLSDAEDFAQSAFAAAFGNWGRISKGANPPGYIYRVAFRSVYKQRHSESPIGFRDLTSVGEDVVGKIAVEAALLRLPQRRRAVAVLSLVLGFNTREIAELLGIAEGTVRKHLEASRRDLRLWLES
jgi:RNA polymerase sigma factor (sigma-70 family)